MAYLASSNDSSGKGLFPLSPPPPGVNCDSAVGECRCNDTDEDRLPDIKDLVSSNFHVMFDLYGNSDNGVGHHP